MKNFSTIQGSKAWKDKTSVECIDYSVLLTKVFGEPIDGAKAFTYLFRRYGFPNRGSDSYKDLCAYSFHTDDKDIIVSWRIGVGDYHHHICAFVPSELSMAIETELRKPYSDYWERFRQWAKQTKGYIHYNPIYLWRIGDGKFCGTQEQEEDIEKYLTKYHDGKLTSMSFTALCEWKKKQGEPIIDEYKTIEPFPESTRWRFEGGFDEQLAAAEEQHAWILSLPDSSQIPRVYYAAMRLFKSWMRYTYIRDVYFNMKCEEHSTCPGRSVEYSHHAGYGIPEETFKKIVRAE